MTSVKIPELMYARGVVISSIAAAVMMPVLISALSMYALLIPAEVMMPAAIFAVPTCSNGVSRAVATPTFA